MRVHGLKNLPKPVSGPDLAGVGEVAEAFEHEAALPGAGEVADGAGQILPTVLARVGDLLHLRREFADLDRVAAVVLPPRVEQLDDPLPLGIPRLDLAEAGDGILAAQRQQGIAHPRAPLLEAAQRDAGLDRVLPSPAPDRERGTKQLGPARLDAFEESGTERALLGVLALGVERDVDEPARQILGDREPVAGEREEGRQLDP